MALYNSGGRHRSTSWPTGWRKAAHACNPLRHDAGNAAARMFSPVPSLHPGKVREATEQLLSAASIQRDPGLLLHDPKPFPARRSRATWPARHPMIPHINNGLMLTAIGHIFQGIGPHREAL